MTLRRGFKAEANSTADEVRGELGLGFLDPLDPLHLAAHLVIPVLGLSELTGAAQGVEYLTHVEPSAFSAITVFRGRRRLIVHNDEHALGRRNSNVTHELAHGLLLHPPTPRWMTAAAGTGIKTSKTKPTG